MMEVKALKDIASFIRTGKTPPTKEDKYFNGEINWYSPGDLDKAKFLQKAKRTITNLAIEDKKAITYPENTLLIGCIGDIGKLGITSETCSSNQQLTGILPNDNTDVSYLYYWFLGNKKVLESYSNNAVVPILNNRNLETIKIPLPPLPEQKRIAAILDAADAYRQKTKALIAHYDALTQSLFLDMFGDPVNNPKGWASGKLIDLCKKKDDVKCGPFGTQLSKDEYQTEGVPIWGIPQINSRFSKKPTEYLTYEKATQLNTYSVEPLDIVMTRKGDVGKCAVYPEGWESGILHSDALRIRCDRNLMEPIFLAWQFRINRLLQTQVSNVSNGAIMAGVNVTKLKGVTPQIPPIELQRDFVLHLHAVETQKEQAQASLEKAENLFNSLLQQAFKGELTGKRAEVIV